MAVATVPSATSSVPFRISRNDILAEFEKAYKFFSSSEETGANLIQAKIKFAEAERAFERASGALEAIMLRIAFQLVKTAKAMAWRSLQAAVPQAIQAAEQYSIEGYRCPRAEDVLEHARAAEMAGDAFRAIGLAKTAEKLFAEVVSDIEESEARASNRKELDERRRTARESRERRREMDRERSRRQDPKKQN